MPLLVLCNKLEGEETNKNLKFKIVIFVMNYILHEAKLFVGVPFTSIPATPMRKNKLFKDIK